MSWRDRWRLVVVSMCSIAMALVLWIGAAQAAAAELLRVVQPVRVNVILQLEIDGMLFGRPHPTTGHLRALSEFHAELWRSVPGAMVIIGYSDRVEESQHLAEQRALAVRDYFVNHGLDPKLMYWEGKLSPRVETRCATELNRDELIECLAPTRRVVIEVVTLVAEQRIPSLRRYLRP